MAAHYLAATADQPLLCVGVVNPGLYDAVPSVQQAHRLRQQAVKALHTARLLQPEAGLLVRFITTCLCCVAYAAVSAIASRADDVG